MGTQSKRALRAQSQSEYVHMRVSAEAKAAIRAAAAEHGMTITDYAVWSMLHVEHPAFVMDEAEMRAVRIELARQGNNLNQIAHAMNSIAAKSAIGDDERAYLNDTLLMIVAEQQAHLDAYEAVGALQAKAYRANSKATSQRA